jgi:predicted MFS family arabinose efflux permease
MATTDRVAPPKQSASGAALAPLREPLFRSLWIAAVISYIGTWMQNIGAGWLMTQLNPSPFWVGMVLTAGTLPVFLVMLPAGAMADMVDRRRLLLFAQWWMVVASAALGILALTHHVSPYGLLLFTFLLGLGSVMNDPAWQAITPEVVAPENHSAAVALNAAGFNVARAVGPALAGFIIALGDSGSVFLLNALSFFGVIVFLHRWKRPVAPPSDPPRLMESMLEGLRYARQSPRVRAVLVRTGVFSVAATAIWALMPLLAQPFGSTGFGVLVGSFGAGALAGAVVLPRIRPRMSLDALIGAAIVTLGAVTLASGRIHHLGPLCIVMFVGGTAWLGILSSFNYAAQIMAPTWVRARSLSIYLLTLQGGMAAGSAFWGALAARIGVPDALAWAGLALAAGLLSIRSHRLSLHDLESAPAVVRD